MPRRRDGGLVALLLVFAAVLRLAGVGDRCAIVFSPTLSGVLEIDRLLREGGFWQAWWASLWSLQGLSLVERSAVMLPIATLVQRVLGPSFELIAIVGCLSGVSSVLLAWLVGRRFADRATALAFAGFVATSPLQIVWSRIGGLHIPSVPHLLVGMWASELAGRSGRPGWAALAGIVVWTSLYDNYETRILIVLVPTIVAWAARRHARGWRETGGLLAAVALPQVLALAALGTAGPMDALWPKYGARGTTPDAVLNLSSLLASCAQALALEAPRVLRAIVWGGRLDPWSTDYGWGIEYGGLYPAVVLVLGVVGLATMVRDPRERLPWLALLAVGFLVPALSGAEPRRLLMFDVGWSFAAALGLGTVVERTRLRTAGRTIVVASTAALFAALGVWSLVAVCRLAAIGDQEFRAIPFGSGTNGDGMFCPPCHRLARVWGDHVARNETVVVVNGTLDLDGALHPGNFDEFGRLAALGAGRPGAIVDFYAALEANSPAPLAALRAAIHETRPDAVVWYVKNPRAWDEELVSTLVRLGGKAEDVAYPYDELHVVGALYAPHVKRTCRVVRTDLAVADAMLDRLEHELYRTEEGGNRARLAIVDEHAAPGLVLGLAAPPASRATEPPRWTALLPNGYASTGQSAASGAGVEVGGIRAVAETAGEPTAALTELGETFRAGADGAPERRAVFPELRPIGWRCSTYVGGAWWVANPLEGTITSTAPMQWIPDRRWIGVARGALDELVLASADGTLAVLNVRTHRLVRELHIPVWPVRRWSVGDCSVVGAGDGWYVSYDVVTSEMAVFADGRRVGDVVLASALDGVPPRNITAVVADGPFLGVGVERAEGFRIVTLRLTLEPERAGYRASARPLSRAAPRASAPRRSRPYTPTPPP